MTGFRVQRATCAFLGALMAFGPVAVQAQTTIRCESESYR